MHQQVAKYQPFVVAPASITDAASVYTALDNQTPSPAHEQRSYYDDGKLETITDYENQVTEYLYDTQGRLEYQHYYEAGNYPGIADEVVQYTYDDLSRRDKVYVDTQEVQDFDYDTEGHVDYLTTPQGEIDYAYSPVTGRQTSVRVPGVNETKIDYAYDSLGRLDTVTTDKRNGQDVDEVTDYEYTSVGSLWTVTYPNGIVATYDYDNLNRLTSLINTNASQQTISSYSYLLAADGMREQVTEADDTVIEWIYDNLNRLEQENRVGSYTHDYTYDLVGNRVKLDDGSSVNYYQYNEMDQLLAESPNPDYTNPTITYGYDENGSLTSKTASGQTTVYGYNLQNRMASVTVGANPAISYKYNPDGIRVSAGNTSYLINPYNPTGYAQVFRETTGSTATIYTIGNDIITQAADTSQPQYFLYDGQGSVRHLTDDTGAIISGQNYNYDAYGSRTDSSTVQTEILYTGQWYDFDSDQYYLRARWYDSSNGRFNRLDPFMGNRWDPQSLHRYLYVYNNPINSTDPYGLFTLSDISHAISIGSKIYNFVDISLSVKKYAKEFTEGVSLGQIAFDAGLNIAVNYAGGKMLEKIIDVAGPAARKFTEKATKRVRKKLCDAHHIIPKFLQGDPSGALAGLTPEMHTKYHKMLKEKLETKFGRKFGGWSTNLEWEQFLSDPLKRMQAAEVLIDTATNLDDELGGDVLTSALLKELSDQDYFIGN